MIKYGNPLQVPSVVFASPQWQTYDVSDRSFCSTVHLPINVIRNSALSKLWRFKEDSKKLNHLVSSTKLVM